MLSDGLMFWTEWGSRPRIERAGMDGTQRTSIVRTDVKWLNGLAVDYQKKRLYWIDAWSRRIEIVDFDGKNRGKLVGKMHRRQCISVG